MPENGIHLVIVGTGDQNIFTISLHDYRKICYINN